MVKGDRVNDLCYQCHAEKRGPHMAHPAMEKTASHHTHGAIMPKLCQPNADRRIATMSAGIDTVYTRFETFSAGFGKNRIFVPHELPFEHPRQQCSIFARADLVR
jgi:hypothetical protein